MKLQLRLAERKGLKSPGAMLVYLALGCVAFLGVLFWVIVWPPMKEYNDLVHQNEQLQQQLATLFNRPKSAKLQEEDLKQLVGQIPTSEELGRFVLALREKESMTGVTILSLDNEQAAAQSASKTQTQGQSAQGKKSQVSIEPKFDESGDAISIDPAVSSYKSTTGNDPKANPSNTNNGKSGSGAQVGANPGEALQLTTLQESKLQMSVSGSYEQAVRFLAELQQMDRFVNVTEWSIQTAPGSIVGDHERLTLQLHLLIYSAEELADKLPKSKELNIPAGSNRTDPTLSEDALLRQIFPAAN